MTVELAVLHFLHSGCAICIRRNEKTDLLLLRSELRGIGQVLHGAAPAAFLEVRAGRLHGVAVLPQHFQLARGGEALLDCGDLRRQSLPRQRALAEHCVATGKLADALQQMHS